MEECSSDFVNELYTDYSPGVTKTVEGDRGAGGRENRGREGYGRREKKGREAGSLRWREAGEKFKKAVKETNPTTSLDFHLTFSEA